MPPNLSMSRGFGLFRNSSLLTAYEHVANSYIDAYIYVHSLCLCWKQSLETTGCPKSSFLYFISRYFSTIGLGKKIV